MSNTDSLEGSPVIIIAAARSGTKILRSTLAASSDFVDFPYDINYIWKYGNYNIPHDELTTNDLRSEIRDFIKKQLRKRLIKKGSGRILEKTVSNCLRVDFVREVFPKCKIIHLYRDGRDVAVSSKTCWESSLFSERIQQKGDLIKKVAQFPFAAAWPYLINYMLNYASRLFSRARSVKSWGPRFKGIDDAVKQYSLIEVCGIQWARCVALALKSLSRLKENEDYINVRYEDFVKDPLIESQKIIDFLQIRDYRPIQEYAKKNITANFIGNAKKKLNSEEEKKLLLHISKYLKCLGYIK